MNVPDVQDKLRLEELGKVIVGWLPERYGFLLIAAPIGDQPEPDGSHVTRYICNFNRENAIATLREWLKQNLDVDA